MRLRGMLKAGEERRLGAVPKPVWLVLAACLLVQLIYAGFRHQSVFRPGPLPPPLPDRVVRLLSLNDAAPASAFLLLWLQSRDSLAGHYAEFRHMDYGRLEGWLRQAIRLDPHSRYALLLAAQVYGGVADRARKRQMFDFVHREFIKRPAIGWQAMAHVTVIAARDFADHRVSLRYAKDLYRLTRKRSDVPDWVKDIYWILLAKSGNDGRAIAILRQRLAESGLQAGERTFLRERLEALKREMTKSRRFDDM
ncbi:MAG: hypothetical protein P8Y64_12375 [Gammaproteobacteria bacterium]